MDGNVIAESKSGKGSSFKVSLPQEKVDNEVLGPSPEVIEAALGQKAELIGNEPEYLQVNSRLLEFFVKDAHKAIGWLEEQCVDNGFQPENEDLIQEFTVIIHGIKGALWSIGENDLAESAKELEAYGRERDVDSIREATPPFLENFHGLLEKIKAKQNANDGNLLSEDYDINDLRTKLRAIKGMCAEYDRKGALAIISGIKKCSQKTKSVLDNVKELVLHSDFDEAENAVEAYAATLAHTGLMNKKISDQNIAKGLKQYNGDEKSHLNILRSYAGSISSMLNAIETFSEDTLDNHDLHYIDEYTPAFLESVRKMVYDNEDMISRLDAEIRSQKKTGRAGKSYPNCSSQPGTMT